MDIQVLTPVKERGATSVMELNRAIQGIVNPVDPSDDTPKIVVKHKKNDEDRTYYIHANDKVMCIKNNYKMSDVLGNPAPVYNGWTGIVTDMTEEYVFVKFPFYCHPVMFAMEDARKYLILGYASTIHKSQGSGFKAIIGVIDYSTPPSMLTCQLVYTLITRAKKLCILVAQNGALRTAIANNFVSIKRTFLQEFLNAS